MLYRQIILEWGQDTESGVWGLGYSPDNGKNFYVLNTTHGRKYRAEDGNRLYPYISDQIQDKIDTVVAPAKSAADSAVNAADAAVASAQVTSDAVSAIASATAEAKQGANEAMSRAKSAWDVATGAKEAVTDFDPLLKSAQSDASNALTQIADTANALSDAKISFGSDVAAAKELANTAQTTADSAATVASDAKSNATVAIQTASQASITASSASGQAASAVLTANGAMTTASNAKSDATVAIQTASGASLTATNAKSDATVAKQTASEAKVRASDAKSDFAQLSIRANKIEANVANNSGAIASVQQTANGLTTTVADIKARGGGVNLVKDSETEFSGKGYGFHSYSFASSNALTPGQTYTMSFSAKIDAKAVNCQQWVFVDVYNPSWSWSINSTSGFKNLSSTDYQRVVYTFTVPTNITDANRIEVDMPNPMINGKRDSSYAKSDVAGTGYIKDFMLEEGSVAHTWSPAPEDTDAKITANTTAIEQNKQAIALKADQTTVDKINGTVSQMQSTLTVQAGQIQEKVTSSQVTGMLAGYATQDYTQSLVTTTSNNWNLNLTNLKTDVDAIKANGGGVNLLTGTSKDELSGKAYWFHDYQISGGLQPGTTYTLSGWARVDQTAMDNQQHIFVYAYTSNWSWGGVLNIDGSLTAKYNTATFTTPSGEQQFNPTVSVYLSHPNGDGSKDSISGTGYISKLMLEKGTVAHDWSPAPSDMATVTSVTNLSATVDGIQAQVYNSDGTSKITQLSNLIAAKVSQGDYNSQINQLNNDINLRVKSADLISQINLQAGTALIQSNKLVLDAGTTVFTGEAFIPSAAISSISADKIMLGSSSLWNSDGTLNLVNQSNGLKALIQVKQGLVQNTTQSIISFSSDYNNRAFSVTPVGATITPTLFFERYDQTAGHWLGFTRNEVRRDGLMFHTWDDEGERFFVGCHARFDRNISVDGNIYQGTWNGTTGKPLAGVLSIQSGNTIWSGSDFLAIGDHLSNSFTNVMARSFSQQSTLSSKTNIETVDPKDALDLVNRTDIRSYQYKTDVEQGKTKRYTSLIIDDVNDVSKYYAPDEFTNEERTGRDDGSAVGYLFLAVKELTRRIKTLEEKLNG